MENQSLHIPHSTLHILKIAGLGEFFERIDAVDREVFGLAATLPCKVETAGTVEHVELALAATVRDCGKYRLRIAPLPTGDTGDRHARNQERDFVLLRDRVGGNLLEFLGGESRPRPHPGNRDCRPIP